MDVDPAFHRRRQRSEEIPSMDNRFRQVWDSIADRGLELLRGRAARASGMESLCRKLLSERGEASGIALARELAERYRKLSAPARESFFLALLRPAFLPDPEPVLAAADEYRNRPDAASLARLYAAAEPPRQELFRRINLAPAGTAALVRMREDLLRFLPARPELKPVDRDLHHLFVSWFNPGFLRLERIDWRTPAAILEKLIEHESVHEIRGWEDLRRRLERDRRCFALFHPALPDEPLIFLEVALTRSLPHAIAPLLFSDSEPIDPQQADTAVFYSISNCLDGLRGIPFGNFLIKHAVAELQAEDLPLRAFATLSPAPLFRTWLDGLQPARRKKLAGDSDLEALAVLEAPQWHHHRKTCEKVRPLLLRLCAHYLLQEPKADGVLDPVASFHLANGASVERINWLGDISAKGLQQSFGLMVNYAYRPQEIERNHERYIKHGRIAAAAAVKSLLHKHS